MREHPDIQIFRRAPDAFEEIEKKASLMEGACDRWNGYQVAGHTILTAYIERIAYCAFDSEPEEDELARAMHEYATEEAIAECMANLDDLLSYGKLITTETPLATLLSGRAHLWGRKLCYAEYVFGEISGIYTGIYLPGYGAPPDPCWQTRLSQEMEAHLQETYEDWIIDRCMPDPGRLKAEAVPHSERATIFVPLRSPIHATYATFTEMDPRYATDDQIRETASRIASYLCQLEIHSAEIAECHALAVDDAMLMAHGHRDLTVFGGRVKTVTFESLVSGDDSKPPVRNVWITLECLIRNDALQLERTELDIVTFPGYEAELTALKTAVTRSGKHGDLLRAAGRTKTPGSVDSLMARLLARLHWRHREMIYYFLSESPGQTFNSEILGLDAEGDQPIETIAIRSGRIVGRIRIGPRVSWNGGKIVAKGYALPQSALSASVGRSMASVIEAPLLEGYIIKKAWLTKDGSACFLVDSEDIPIAAFLKKGRGSNKN